MLGGATISCEYRKHCCTEKRCVECYLRKWLNQNCLADKLFSARRGLNSLCPSAVDLCCVADASAASMEVTRTRPVSTSQRGGQMESVGATSWSSGTMAAVQESSDLVRVANRHKTADIAWDRDLLPALKTFWYEDLHSCSRSPLTSSNNHVPPSFSSDTIMLYNRSPLTWFGWSSTSYENLLV